MKYRLTALLLSAALLLPLAACGQRGTGERRFEASFLDLFDTMTNIVGYAGSREAFTQTAQAIHDELEEYHRLYDIYNDYEGVNNVKTINDSAGVAPVAVDRRIIDLLLEAKEMNALTGGKVNVAMGSVLSIWHEYREYGSDLPEQAALPPMAELKQASFHTDIDDVIIDEENNTVYLADPDMRLDVGAIAKGYAAQRVSESAAARGVERLLLSVGGNVCAVGGRPGGGPWKVSVQDPEDRAGWLYVMGLSDRCLVTSGDYQRYYVVDGVRYHHIIDPDTLMPAAYYAAVSVLTEDSGSADALSTALYNLPYDEGLALVERLDGVEALWVFHDGTRKATAGFQKLILQSNGEA